MPARACGFDPHDRHNAFVAQSVERSPEKGEVGGSIPPEGTQYTWRVAHTGVAARLESGSVAKAMGFESSSLRAVLR